MSAEQGSLFEGEEQERKRCSKCKMVKTVDDFYFDSTRGKPCGWCKSCRRASRLAYYRLTTPYAPRQLGKSDREVRLEMIASYGGACQCCGVTEWEFLSLDHINGNGKQDREEIGGSATFFRHLMERGWPKDNFRILCYNCNCAREHHGGGVCPHHLPPEPLPVLPSRLTLLKRCPRCGEMKDRKRDFYRMGLADPYCNQCRPEYCKERRQRQKLGQVELVEELPDVHFGLGVLRRCPRCDLWKVAVSSFHRHNGEEDGFQPWCIDCAREMRLRRRVAENKRARIRDQLLRLEVLAALGDACVCCGEADSRFLTIDHINGGGSVERKTPGLKGSLYRRVKRAGFPRDVYRCLCYNCNLSRGTVGYCPHEKAISPTV